MLNDIDVKLNKLIIRFSSGAEDGSTKERVFNADGKDVTLRLESNGELNVLVEGEKYVAYPSRVRIATEMYRNYWPLGPIVDFSQAPVILFDNSLVLKSIDPLPPLDLRIQWILNQNMSGEKHLNIEFTRGKKYF